MHTATTRRVFLGSAVAIGAAGFLPPVLAQQASSGRFDDPVLTEILKQLEAAAQQLQRRPTPDLARQIAATYRLRAAWGRSRDFDAIAREKLGRSIAMAGGEQALVARATRWDVEAEMKMAGYTLPTPFAPFTSADAARALSDLRRNGAVYRWNDLADQYESGASRVALIAPAAARLQDDLCANLRAYELMLEGTVFFFCYVLGVELPEACAVVTLDLLLWKAWMWWSGC
jgi:hypothetical protein